MTIKALTGLGQGVIELAFAYGKLLNKQTFRILQIIDSNKHQGTIKLAAAVGIAPKNLIRRLKALLEFGLITKENIPAKPSGRIRIYKLTQQGKEVLSLSNK